MKKYTQEEFNNFEIDKNGFKICPSGIYTSFNNFEDKCIFGKNSYFKENSSFGKNCYFENNCHFSKNYSFGNNCVFENKCTFKKSNP